MDPLGLGKPQTSSTGVCIAVCTVAGTQCTMYIKPLTADINHPHRHTLTSYMAPKQTIHVLIHACPDIGTIHP